MAARSTTTPRAGTPVGARRRGAVADRGVVAKITGAVGLVALTTLVVVLVGLLGIRSLAAADATMFDRDIHGITQVERMQLGFVEIRMPSSNAALQTDPAVKAAIYADRARISDELQERIATFLQRDDLTDQERAVVAEVGTQIDTYIDVMLRIEHVAHAAADRDLSQRTGVDSGDETGRAARSLDHALDEIGAVITRAVTTAEQVRSSVGELDASSRAVAEQAGGSVAEAAGTAQMTASIQEIAKNAADAATVAAAAVDVAGQTNQTVSQLGESSAQIGELVRAITAIAEQTNLLALNATIEAARAGDAGKGFAVVATEVKELAQETSTATEDIGRRVAAIQLDTQAAVAAIGRISTIIEQINDTQSTIASAVEQQAATTNEISRNVSDAARGSADISAGIDDMARSVTVSRDTFATIAGSLDELASTAEEMRRDARAFTV